MSTRKDLSSHTPYKKIDIVAVRHVILTKSVFNLIRAYNNSVLKL